MGDTVQNRKRLNSLERSQLLRFGVALDLLCEPYADQRFAALKYGKRDLGMIRKKAATLLEDVLETVPIEQNRQLAQHMKYATVTIGVAKMSAHQHDHTYGGFLTNSAMQALANACVEKCRLCMLDKHSAKKCELRAALDEMWIVGVEGTENDCPYFQL